MEILAKVPHVFRCLPDTSKIDKENCHLTAWRLQQLRSIRQKWSQELKCQLSVHRILILHILANEVGGSLGLEVKRHLRLLLQSSQHQQYLMYGQEHILVLASNPFQKERIVLGLIQLRSYLCICPILRIVIGFFNVQQVQQDVHALSIFDIMDRRRSEPDQVIIDGQLFMIPQSGLSGQHLFANDCALLLFCLLLPQLINLINLLSLSSKLLQTFIQLLLLVLIFYILFLDLRF